MPQLLWVSGQRVQHVFMRAALTASQPHGSVKATHPAGLESGFPAWVSFQASDSGPVSPIHQEAAATTPEEATTALLRLGVGSSDRLCAFLPTVFATQ